MRMADFTLVAFSQISLIIALHRCTILRSDWYDVFNVLKIF